MVPVSKPKVKSYASPEEEVRQLLEIDKETVELMIKHNQTPETIFKAKGISKGAIEIIREAMFKADISKVEDTKAIIKRLFL